MIDLLITQDWLTQSDEGWLENYKSLLPQILNATFETTSAQDRWSISRISEGEQAYLIYDEQPLLALKIQDRALIVTATRTDLPRYNEILYALRFAAQKLYLSVHSNLHGGALLPSDYQLALDHTYFTAESDISHFFANSSFIPRFADMQLYRLDDGKESLFANSPFYAEHKDDGSIHIINDFILQFLAKKQNQEISEEFSYKVADSMQDFARKHNLGLIPKSFYQNYGKSMKIINEFYFDTDHITRKIFIYPTVWDFDEEHDYRYYKNVETGMSLMDKVRPGETLDDAIKRTLQEELKVADDYVAARVVGMEFDRDKEGMLTPRLILNVFVHGMNNKLRSDDHDWVSI